MIRSGFFNSDGGDRKYDAHWFSKFFGTIIGNGIFTNPTSSLQVVSHENMQTAVRAGNGWINGYFITNDGDYILQHDTSDGTLKRIDRIVMRLDLSKRQIEIVIKKGTLSSSPVAPTLQRDTTIYELVLADVNIDNGMTEILQTKIKDQRFDSDLCGVVKSLVDDIDTTDLFAQYDASFNEWFADVKEMLDGDVAGNLLNRINDLQLEVDENKNAIDDLRVKLSDDKNELLEKINLNSYDDYQLWLELYYKGIIGQIDISNTKAIILDGFLTSENLEGDVDKSYNHLEHEIHAKGAGGSYIQHGSDVRNRHTTWGAFLWQSFRGVGVLTGFSVVVANKYSSGSRSVDYWIYEEEAPSQLKLMRTGTLGLSKAPTSGVWDYQLERITFGENYQFYLKPDRRYFLVVEGTTDVGWANSTKEYSGQVSFYTSTKDGPTTAMMPFTRAFEIEGAQLIPVLDTVIYSKEKQLSFTPKSAKLYISVQEPQGTSVKPSITSNGTTYVDMQFESERTDPKHPDFKEKIFNVTFEDPEQLIKLKLSLNTATDNTPLVKRYGLLIS